MPYTLLETHPVGQMASLDNTKGGIGQLALDQATGNLYMKFNGTWTQINTNGAQGGNAAGHANTAVVANGSTATLKKSDGVTTSSGNATLNSPATMVIANGQISSVKCSA